MAVQYWPNLEPSPPEAQAQSVLDFIEFLREKLRRNKVRQQEATDMSEFDQFGAVYDGTFDRNACYDRPVLR